MVDDLTVLQCIVFKGCNQGVPCKIERNLLEFFTEVSTDALKARLIFEEGNLADSKVFICFGTKKDGELIIKVPSSWEIAGYYILLILLYVASTVNESHSHGGEYDLPGNSKNIYNL